jgi:hypothetical protein
MTEHKRTRTRKISIRLSEQEVLMLQNACDINISEFVRDAVKHYMAWLDARRPAKLVSGKAKYIPRGRGDVSMRETEA